MKIGSRALGFFLVRSPRNQRHVCAVILRKRKLRLVPEVQRNYLGRTSRANDLRHLRGSRFVCEPLRTPLHATARASTRPILSNVSVSYFEHGKSCTVETPMLASGAEPTVTVHVVVSEDGKTRTATYSGKIADGKVVHTVMVYDKREIREAKQEGWSESGTHARSRSRIFSAARGRCGTVLMCRQTV